jgi:hypothetical protein
MEFFGQHIQREDCEQQFSALAAAGITWELLKDLTAARCL